MGGDHTTDTRVNKMSFYPGSSTYGLDKEFENPINHTIPASSIALTTNPQTANQLREVFNQLSSGAKAVEVNLLTPQVSESIPNQHLDELNRLRKLVGAELNVHGPLVEPTGINQQGMYEENQRLHGERQMWNAIEQAHRISPDRNVVVTFHSSNGLPEPETKEKYFDEKDKKWKEKVSSIGIINQRGQVQQMSAAVEPNKWLGKEEGTVYDEIKRYNDEKWRSTIANTNIELNRVNQELRAISQQKKENEQEVLHPALDLFKMARTNPDTYQREFAKVQEKFPDKVGDIKQLLNEFNYSEALTKNSYRSFQALFNEAYNSADKTLEYGKFARTAEEKTKVEQAKKDKERLEELRKKLAEPLEKLKEQPDKIFELGEKVQEGMQILGGLKTVPEMYRGVREFALDKASETFSNLALQSYKTYEKDAPIISIENPPTGMGLSRAEDLKALIELSQEKFVSHAVKNLHMEKDEAQRQAKKLIGATWDVGHINMMQKHGYTKEDIVEQTKMIAKHVKNIHMSDNFGLDHTELPMGMGNVPMQGHLKELQKAHGEQLDKIKKIVETGHWYTHFKTNPFAETLAAFGSPIYGMNMAPYWNQGLQTFGSYFSGYGMNPDTHHSIYGAGFSGLPVELGGNIQGKSRLSGAPIE